jgi:hypothetical protein
MGEQILIVRLPDTLARRAIKYLDRTAQGYESLNEFIAGAVANQLNLLEDAPPNAEQVGAIDIRDFFELSHPEPLPLFVLTNRLAPIKIGLRALANLRSTGSWPTLSTFSKEASKSARTTGLTLRGTDEALGKRAYDRRWIGFPVGDDVEAALNRFVSSFTCQGAAGPMGILGLASIDDDGLVGLTELGHKIALLPSPLLGEIDEDGSLSQAEAKAFCQALHHAKHERDAIVEFLQSIEQSDGVQKKVDRRLAEAHADWSSARVTSHRAAMIGRLSDAKVLRVGGKGPTSTIELLDNSTFFTTGLQKEPQAS